MKEMYPPCGCRKPPSPCDREQISPLSCQPSLFMQKILGSGRIHQRRKCYPIQMDPLPCSACGTITLISVVVCGAPAWTEVCCHERGAKLLQILIPLSLEFQDSNGCRHHASGVIEEKLRLSLSCRSCDAWRGQILIQAAARLCGPVCVPANSCPEAPLELILCGYLLSPCAIGAPSAPPCPPPKPWYPHPHFDPYQDG